MNAAAYHVVLYSKPECHLCETARAWLDTCAADPDQFVPFMLDEVDIRLDPALFEQYRYRIPVITLAGRIIAEGRMDDDAAAAIANALTRRGTNQ